MARDPYPSEIQDRFLVRLPEGMRERIKDEAERNKRSMNAEIIARLEQSFAAPTGFDAGLMVNMEFMNAFKDWVLENYVVENERLIRKTAKVQRAKAGK
jgi:hypothetical protein